MAAAREPRNSMSPGRDARQMGAVWRPFSPAGCIVRAPRVWVSVPGAMKETDMGLLDGMIGGVVAGVVNNVLERHGGLPGVVSAFERQGFGATVQSWVGKGENLPISAE